MRHKSNMHWAPLIEGTLRKEYNLSVTSVPFDPSSVTAEAMQLRARARGRAADETAIPFSPDLLLNEGERDELRLKSRSGASLTSLQRQQLYTTFVFRDRWGIYDDLLFDEDFYNKYVGLVSNWSETEKARRIFYAYRRQVLAGAQEVCGRLGRCRCVVEG